MTTKKKNKPRLQFEEEIIGNFDLCDLSLQGAYDKIKALLTEHGPDAYFYEEFDYGETSLRLVKNIIEDDSMYNERMVHEAIDETKAAEKAALKAAKKAEQLKLKSESKESEEKALYEQLKQKYENPEDLPK